MAAPKLLNSDFWDNFAIEQEDIEFLYNQLLELEIPQTPSSLLKLIVGNRIKAIKEVKEKEKVGEVIYIPRDHYKIGQTLIFPAIDWKSGLVENIRIGFNPEFESFEVMDIVFENGDKQIRTDCSIPAW